VHLKSGKMNIWVKMFRADEVGSDKK